MSSYTLVLRGADQIGPGKQLQRMLNNLARLDQFMDELGDEVVLPILAEHYQAAGIKTHTGDLLAAITKRGAKGNIFQKIQGRLVVGVDYNALPYARWVIEGRGYVFPVRAKMLRWFDEQTGKPIFAKFARPAPKHPIYYLGPGDLTRLENVLMAKLTMTQSRTKLGRFSY